jgi:hypothetical protein
MAAVPVSDIMFLIYITCAACGAYAPGYAAANGLADIGLGLGNGPMVCVLPYRLSARLPEYVLKSSKRLKEYLRRCSQISLGLKYSGAGDAAPVRTPRCQVAPARTGAACGAARRL